MKYNDIHNNFYMHKISVMIDDIQSCSNVQYINEFITVIKYIYRTLTCTITCCICCIIHQFLHAKIVHQVV